MKRSPDFARPRTLVNTLLTRCDTLIFSQRIRESVAVTAAAGDQRHEIERLLDPLSEPRPAFGRLTENRQKQS